ncbi:hypothetical protein [Streptosporangium sp. 'caverna']|uniref:hypothetical protein n=1 Tax=Streptosporangium sp. 'caverna' TaxID=2202249 RepID=UPI001EF75EE3|nr:hypothetical protein [Streptosporangium sp. 'caverna']
MSEKTHRQVLPQPAALESVGADNPGDGDETVHRLPARPGTGVKHGRGEIAADGTHPLRRHPDTVTTWPRVVLVVKATGRGTYARTRADKYGFPRLALPRTKTIRGFQTGDLVRAVVPTGKKAGTHTGRVAVRSTGSFNIRTRHDLVQGINHRYVRLLQRADGYAYTTYPEARHRAAFPPGPEEPGIHAGGS